MFHITDWLPTIVHGILGRDDLLKDMSVVQDSMDGVNHWKQLLEGSDSSSEKSYPSKAPRREILIGIDYLNAQDEWVGYDTAAVIVGYDKLVTNEVNETWWDTPGTADTTREPLELNTETPVYTFLFNLRNDPEEKVDLSEVYPEKVEQLKSVLASYRKTMVNNLFCADTTSNYLDADSIQEVDGFIRPWATNTAICPERICFDGVSEKDYYPSYLNGEYPI
jgi:hypothetical protein